MFRVFRRRKPPIVQHPLRCESLESRMLMTISITATMPAVSAASGAGALPIDLSSYFSEPTPESDIAFFSTNFGVIPVQLTPGTTPNTVANFEKYVNRGVYNGSIISSSQPGDFFSGGTYNIVNDQLNTITADAPIASEFGASNVRGTLAMALASSDPNSATDAFLFNVSDNNSAIFDSEKQTVFGDVVGSYGMGVLDAISTVPVPNPAPISSLPSLPINNYTAGTTVTVGQLVQVSSISIGSEGFSVVSDNPAVAVAVVSGSNLTYSPLAEGIAHLTVTGVGSDGVAVSQTFAVVVGSTEPATPITPSAVGVLPASLVSGHAAKIRQPVALTASQDINANTTIAMNLTPTSGNGADFIIATAQKHLKLKAGKRKVIRLSAKAIPAGVPGGTYQVTIAIAETGSKSAVALTGQTVTVSPPQINLGGSFKKLSTKLRTGHKGSAIMLLTNTGNSEASGLLKLNVTKSTDDTLLDAPIRAVHIKPGKAIAIHLSWNAGVAGEDYSLNVAIDPDNVFADSDRSNNAIPGPGVVVGS